MSVVCTDKCMHTHTHTTCMQTCTDGESADSKPEQVSEPFQQLWDTWSPCNACLGMTLDLCVYCSPPPQDWLSRFGYLPPPDPVTGQLQTKEALANAIKAMQRFGGLKETGVLGVWGPCLFFGRQINMESKSRKTSSCELLFSPLLFRPSHTGSDETTQMFSARCARSRGDDGPQETKPHSPEQME